jgi:hypothetical protein
MEQCNLRTKAWGMHRADRMSGFSIYITAELYGCRLFDTFPSVLSLSRLHRVSDRMINVYVVLVGTRIGRRKRSTRRKTSPSASLSTTNPIWPDYESNPGRRGGKPAINEQPQLWFKTPACCDMSNPLSRISCSIKLVISRRLQHRDGMVLDERMTNESMNWKEFGKRR